MASTGVYIDSSDEDFEVWSDYESGSDDGCGDEADELSAAPHWEPLVPRPTRVLFNKLPGLKVTPPPPATASDYFAMLFDDDLINSIIHHTNLYGAQYVKRNKPSSLIPGFKTWVNVTIPEFKTFIGLLLHMGTIRMSRLSSYWNSAWLFGLKCFPNNMCAGRFLVILRCLQFSGSGAPDDPLRKVRNLVNYFNRKMDAVYYPGRILWLGEGKTVWRAQVTFPAGDGGGGVPGRGVKLYSLTEAEGVTLRCELRPLGLQRGEAAMTDIALSLLQGKLNSGHAVYLDRNYTGFTLARALLSLNTVCTGMLRLDRRHTPADIRSASLQPGEVVTRAAQGVMIGRWRDTSDITFLSTEYDHTMTTVLTRTGMQTKPVAVARCNVNKVCRREGPVSMFEDELPCFRYERRAFTWTKRLFVRVLNLCVANSYLLLRRREKTVGYKRSYQEFRLALIQSLLPCKVAEEPPTRVQPVMLMRCPEHTPSKADKKNSSTKRKRCRVCGDKGLRKDTTYVCKACPGEPGLCIIKCFDEYHRQTHSRFNTKGTQVMMDPLPPPQPRPGDTD